MIKVVEETIAVARAAGVHAPGPDFTEKWLKALDTFGEATSSTAQDLARGKRTEIESLNGYIVRRGAELGVPTPSNFAVYAMVKLAGRKNGAVRASAPSRRSTIKSRVIPLRGET